MSEDMILHRCRDSAGAMLLVVERRHIFTTHGTVGTRRQRGSARATLLDGEPVRYIDAGTFEIVATGERLIHDRAQCDCAPAARFSTSSAAGNICQM